MSNFLFVKDFEKKHSREWINISKAEDVTNVKLKEIGNIFLESPIPVFSSDVDLVVFGSIARNECSLNSDIDWTILVDGQASSSHYEFSHLVRTELEKIELQGPGNTGMFGQITFSHDLIHYIGGEDDTNHNISRRILLLLESDNIVFNSKFGKSGTPYDRVIRGIIEQYISNDSGFSSDRGKEFKVPRFLLNDIIRYWRTMCVDFAYKQKEQKGKKWALRNIKLRMSRKLIFVKGLLMCFSCYQNEKIEIKNINEHLRNLSAMKPLDVVIKVLAEHNIDEKDILNLFDAYDKFLSLLSDRKERDYLSELDMLKVYESPQFIEARKIADDFQNALTNIFINKNSLLKDFTLKYGILRECKINCAI